MNDEAAAQAFFEYRSQARLTPTPPCMCKQCRKAYKFYAKHPEYLTPTKSPVERILAELEATA